MRLDRSNRVISERKPGPSIVAAKALHEGVRKQRRVALPVSVAMQSLGTQLGNTLASWFDSAAMAERLTPLSRTYLLIGYAPLLVWAGLWMFGAVERTVRNLPARRG